MKKNKNYFAGKTILITGATGSFGKAFLGHLLKNYSNIRKIIVFSRDELKQFDLSLEYPERKYPNLRYFLGDVRDKDRLLSVTENVDYVVHAAAQKQVPAAEYNPFEAIKTNIIGAQNLIEACITQNVKKIIALSTDKAVAPQNLYGATKLCSDKLFISANEIKGKKKISFSIVRYGNVMGSRGSVIPVFLKQKKTGKVMITDENMTRFNVLMDKAIETVIWSLQNSKGGEVIIPKAPSYRIEDLAKAIAPKCQKKVIGIRPGEKLHEEMINQNDAMYTYELKDKYIISHKKNDYLNKPNIKKVKKNFSYNSKENKFLTINEIKKLVIKHFNLD
jgi:UDP-N-acetylglucosamine 4,6-dehydratase/5-epimerase